MPRYTCAESTLTISTGRERATASASGVLPLAVGPMTRIAAGSAATHEELVEVRKAHLEPGRAAMVALPRALGFLHLAQERVHLRDGQRPVRAYRAVAGHGAEQLIAALGEHAARAVLADVAQQRARQNGRVGFGEHRRDGPDG